MYLLGLATKIPKNGLIKNLSGISQKCSKNPIKTPKNPVILKKLGDCGENSTALVGFLLAPLVSAKSTRRTNSAEASLFQAFR